MEKRLLSVRESAAYLGVSRMTFLRRVEDKKLPKAIKISKRRVVWDVKDLDSYIDKIKKS